MALVKPKRQLILPRKPRADRRKLPDARLRLPWVWVPRIIPARASIAYVQGNSHLNGAGSSSTVAVTLGAAVANLDTVCVTVGFQDTAGDAVTGITDDKLNNYIFSPAAKVNNAGASFSLQTAYLIGINNAPSIITATLSASKSFLAIIVDEWSGVGSFDGSVGNPQSSAGTGTDAITSTAIVTTGTGDLIYGSGISIANAGLTVGTGFTLRQSALAEYFTEGLIQGSPGSVAATFTAASGTDSTIAIVLAFKPSSAVVLPFGNTMQTRMM